VGVRGARPGAPAAGRPPPCAGQGEQLGLPHLSGARLQPGSAAGGRAAGCLAEREGCDLLWTEL